MDQQQFRQTLSNNPSNSQPGRDTQAAQDKGMTFNFDMNEEFIPGSAMTLNTKKETSNKKKKKPRRPERLPFAITHYNRAAINFLFMLVFMTSIAMGLDQGALAAASVEIKIVKAIDNFQFGGLQSLVFVGLLMGQAISPLIFKRIAEKLIIAVALGMIVLSMFLFVVLTNFPLLCLSRFIYGFFQAYLGMFFLAWIDTFGVGHQKQSWLSIMMLSPFFSYFIGYIIASLVASNAFPWQIMFGIQGFLLIPCIMFTLFTPLKYFDLDSAIELKKHQEELQRQGTYRSNESKKLTQDWNAYTSFGQPSVIIAGSLEARMREKYYTMDINLNEQQKLEEELIQNVKITQYDMAKIVIKNKSFIFFTLSMTGYYFLLSGLQLFFTDYAQRIILESKEVISIYYTVIALMAPVFGVYLGAYITTKVGGSSSPQALGILCLAAFFATVVALPIPFILRFGPLMLMMTFLLFFVGMILPILGGQLMYTVTQELRVAANSVASLSFILLGFIPAPSVYGLMTRISLQPSRYPMGILVYSTVISTAFLFIALISQLKSRKLSEPKVEKIKSAVYADPNNQQQYYMNTEQRNGGEYKSDDSLINQAHDHNQHVDEDNLIRASSFAQLFQGPDSARAHRPLDENGKSHLLASPSGVRVKPRAEAQKKKGLHLSNINRLKYDSVHIMIGRIFIPQSLGIVNEDFYI